MKSMLEKKLTVIIPVYNTGNFLKRCINSLINQTLKELEIIIVDDNSSDDSPKIAKEYASNYTNIKYFRNSSTLGPGGARNVGLNLVNTKYVCFLDSDDWVDTNTYKSAISILDEEDSCDIAIYGIKTEYNTPYSVELRYQYKNSNIISRDFALALLCKTFNQDLSISALLGNKVFRTALIKDNNIIFKELYFEDEIYSFLAILYSRNIAIVPSIYLHYYQRPHSIMHSFSKKYIDDTLEIFNLLRKHLEEKEIFTIYKSDYYAFFMRCYSTLLNTLFATEQNVELQKKYLLYFATSFAKRFSLGEIIDYLDINIIKKIFLIEV